MAGQSKLSGPSEDRLHEWPSYRWFVPILWGLGIAALVGIPTITVIFLNQKHYLPSWVFGWISSDREIQKRQFWIALSGISAFGVALQFIKFGLFGEMARNAYDKIALKLGGPKGRTSDEDHAKVCAVKNVRLTIFLVVWFALEVFQSWRALGNSFGEHNLYDLLFRIVLMLIIFPLLFQVSRCVPERFITGIITIRIVTGWVFEYVPNLASSSAHLVRVCNLMLWALALLTSLVLLVSSLTKPRLSL